MSTLHVESGAAFQTFSAAVSPELYKLSVRQVKLIKDAVSRRLFEVGEVSEGFDAVNLDPKKVYGCGAFGCAWPLISTDRFVIKISLDPTEGPLWQLFATDPQIERLYAFPTVLGVWKLAKVLRARSHKLTPYIILREDIQPLRHSQEALDDNDWFYEVDQALERIRTGAQEVERHKYLIGSSKEEIGRVAAEWKAEMKNSALMIPELKALVELSNAVYKKYGIVLADLHIDNVGWRQHDIEEGKSSASGFLVALDLGRSELPSWAPIKGIEDLVANPGIEVLK